MTGIEFKGQVGGIALVTCIAYEGYRLVEN